MASQAFGTSQLTIRFPNGKTQSVPLERDQYELGRAESNALCFQDVTGLSRRHAAFERNGSKWMVRDLGSTNGTFVNGIRISAQEALRSNDRVDVGELSVVFTETPPPAAQTVFFIENSPATITSTATASVGGVRDAEKEIHSSAHMKALIHAGRELAGHTSL